MEQNEHYPVDSGLTYADAHRNYKDNSPGIVKLATAYLAARFISNGAEKTGKHLADHAEMPSPHMMQNLRQLNNNG